VRHALMVVYVANAVQPSHAHVRVNLLEIYVKRQ
jgi:hypothetical protein